MNKTIKYAGVAGIFSIILAIPITYFEILKSLNKLEGNLISLYIFVLLVSLILYIVFLYGFKIIGDKFSNNLLKLTSVIWGITAIIYYGYIILSLLSPSLESNLVSILAVVIFGIVGIPFGIALLKLKAQFGSLAKGAGIITIIIGVSCVSVILLLLGLILLIPFYILTSMILFRAAKKIETNPAI